MGDDKFEKLFVKVATTTLLTGWWAKSYFLSRALRSAALFMIAGTEVPYSEVIIPLSVTILAFDLGGANARDHMGRTPVMVACINGVEKNTSSLLGFAHTDVYLVDNAGLSARAHAVLNPKGNCAKHIVARQVNDIKEETKDSFVYELERMYYWYGGNVYPVLSCTSFVCATWLALSKK